MNIFPISRRLVFFGSFSVVKNRGLSCNSVWVVCPVSLPPETLLVCWKSQRRRSICFDTRDFLAPFHVSKVSSGSIRRVVALCTEDSRGRSPEVNFLGDCCRHDGDVFYSPTVLIVDLEKGLRGQGPGCLSIGICRSSLAMALGPASLLFGMFKQSAHPTTKFEVPRMIRDR